MEIKKELNSLYENGFLYVENLYDPTELITDVPTERGKYDYYGKIDKVVYSPEEGQVKDCFSRYNYPPYQHIHNNIRVQVEKILGIDLFNTYYFDRFYFVNQELTKHFDRDACEISVSLHISSNTKHCWPLFFKSSNGKINKVNMKEGDGVIYLGCDIEHWREPLESKYSKIQRKINSWLKKSDDTYYHQIFFHYVNANGKRVQFAFDKGR